MLFSTRNYAIGLAHYQIAGGNKGLALLLGGYVAIASVVFGLISYNAESAHIPMIMLAVTTFLLVAQAFAMVVVGSARIAGCIRSDTTTNMLESHRMMPVSSWRVVLSYMFGTTSQLLTLLALNAMVLLVTHSLARVSLDSWVISQVVLAFFALMVWSFVAMGGFMIRQAMPLMVLGLVGGGIASAYLRQVGILPALTLLGSPFLGETIFNLSGGRINTRPLYAIALPAQLSLATLFFIGACRRYRGAYHSTFNIGMGVALVFLWGALSSIGIVVWDRALQSLPFLRQQQPGAPQQIVAALTAAALLAIVPAHATAAWEHARGLSVPRLVLTLAGVLAGAIIPMFMVVAPSAWAITLALLTCHVLCLVALFRFTRERAPLTVGGSIIAFFFGIWLAPLFIEMIRWVVVNRPGIDGELSTISTFSPLGILMSTWKTGSTTPSVYVGLGFQAILTAVLWNLGRRRIRLLAEQRRQSLEA